MLAASTALVANCKVAEPLQGLGNILPFIYCTKETPFVELNIFSVSLPCRLIVSFVARLMACTLLITAPASLVLKEMVMP
jgi:hypothetical protein